MGALKSDTATGKLRTSNESMKLQYKSLSFQVFKEEKKHQSFSVNLKRKQRDWTTHRLSSSSAVNWLRLKKKTKCSKISRRGNRYRYFPKSSRRSILDNTCSTYKNREELNTRVLGRSVARYEHLKHQDMSYRTFCVIVSRGNFEYLLWRFARVLYESEG